MYRQVIFLILFWGLLAPMAWANPPLNSEQLGEVEFATSCGETAQAHFETGLKLLHHMMYLQAETAFSAAIEVEPRCGMAHWGVAMTHFHPLWPGKPSQADLNLGLVSLEQAGQDPRLTVREQAYIAALDAFYRDWANRKHAVRVAEWESLQKKIYQDYPQDVDAAALYALAHLATAPKTDRAFVHQREAGAILEYIYATHPRHPGLNHYLIHAYDNPPLALRALAVARAYDQIAPEVPHALHMPTHIFTRLGLWPDSIDWNRRSADAAKKQPVGDAASLHYAHALDYLIYAYLQRGEDKRAKQVLDELNGVEKFQANFAVAYGVAAAQARYPLERRQWREAANLPLRTHAGFPWDDYPWYEAMLYFARGLGAAQIGEIDQAQAAIETLNATYQRSLDAGENYWAVLVDAQRQTVAAWAALAQGQQVQALELMKRAAELEDSVDKNPVTPGAVLPARELLGDMLLQLGHPAEALQAYQQALLISPNRYHSLYGAGEAAQSVGDDALAENYFRKLQEVAPHPSSARKEYAEAKAFLK